MNELLARIDDEIEDCHNCDEHVFPRYLAKILKAFRHFVEAADTLSVDNGERLGEIIAETLEVWDG